MSNFAKHSHDACNLELNRLTFCFDILKQATQEQNKFSWEIIAIISNYERLHIINYYLKVIFLTNI